MEGRNRGDSVALAALLCASLGGCTRLLGIDRDYALADGVGVDDSGVIDRVPESAPAPRVDATREKSPVDAGGPVASDDGEAQVPEEAASPREPVDAGFVAPCPIGHFRGNFTGQHYPWTGGTLVPVDVRGTVDLQITGSARGGAIITGRFDGDVRASIVTTLDCATGCASGELTEGTVLTLIPPDQADIEGTVRIFVANEATLRGSYTEHETHVDMASGSGTFTATLSN